MKAFADILKQLKNKQYQPVYFLQGEETYFIDQVSDYIEQHVLDDAGKGFDLSVLYGKEMNVQSVLDVVKRYPMMSPYHVVILKEAQHLKNIDKLLECVEKPIPTTIFVVCHKYKSVDKRTKFGKILSSKTVFLDSKKLYDNQIPAWITSYIEQQGYQIDLKAATLVGEHLGSDLSKVTNELNKLFINLPKGKKIDAAIVEQNIGISKDYNIFEVQNALSVKDIVKTNTIIKYFIANPKNNPFVLVVGMLYAFFSKVFLVHQNNGLQDRQLAEVIKVNPFFVKTYKIAAKNYPLNKTEQIMHYLHEYDLKSKGINNPGTPEGELLREMTYKILHV